MNKNTFSLNRFWNGHFKRGTQDMYANHDVLLKRHRKQSRTNEIKKCRRPKVREPVFYFTKAYNNEG